MRIGSEKETQRACWKNCYLGYKAPKAKWRPAPRKARFLCDKDVKLAATEKVSLWSQNGAGTGEACLRKVEITLALALSLSGSFSSFVVRLPLANYC